MGRKREDINMPLVQHLKELRKVLVVSAYTVAIGAVFGWIFADPFYAYLARPVLHLSKVSFITTTPLEPILVKLKVSLVIGVVVALPVILWQIWSFILPALKQNERKYLYLIVPASFILFLAGAAFCFYIVLPVGIKYLLLIGGGVQSTPFVTKSSYLNFMITFLVTFGAVFQLPIVLLMLIRIGLLSPRTLARKRKWAIFIIVIAAVIVAPTPDLLTQGLMAAPMYLLYEVSIWLGYLVVRRRVASSK